MTITLDWHQVTGLDDLISARLAEFEHEVRFQVKPSQPNSVNSFLLDSYKEIATQTQQYTRGAVTPWNVASVAEIKTATLDALLHAKAQVIALNAEFVETGRIDAEDVGLLLTEYAEAQYGNAILCFRNPSYPAVVAADEESELRTVDCDGYRDNFLEIERYTQTLGGAPAIPPQLNKIYLSASYTPISSWLREYDEYAGFQDTYSWLGLSLGYQMPDPLRARSGIAGNTHAFVSSDVSWVMGNAYNQKSSRFSAGVKAGVRPYFGDWLSLAPALGLAFAYNKLNYGKGYLPEPKSSLLGIASLDAYFSPWHSPIAMVTTLRYENSFVGLDHYQNAIVAVGVGLPLMQRTE